MVYKWITLCITSDLQVKQENKSRRQFNYSQGHRLIQPHSEEITHFVLYFYDIKAVSIFNFIQIFVFFFLYYR